MYPLSTAACTLSVREPDPDGAPKPRLLHRVRGAVRARHHSRRTEEAYIAWIRRFIVFHGKRHPEEMGAPVPDKVMNDMRGCGAAIIHGEVKLLDQDAKEHTVINSNVLIEIGAAMALYGRDSSCWCATV